ncbi:MAG TPA: hypothetical protein H9836_16100, partial [Candidatus Nocardiopsis merdipullorum]|nr:hypothetical protein [Candidatus Nocardiopsis merdipullorum]
CRYGHGRGVGGRPGPTSVAPWPHQFAGPLEVMRRELYDLGFCDSPSPIHPRRHALTRGAVDRMGEALWS